MFLLDSGAVVGYAESPEIAVIDTGDFYPALGFVMIFYGIAYKVLEQLHYVCFFANNGRQLIFDSDFNMLRRHNHIDNFRNKRIEVHLHLLACGLTYFGISQHAVDEIVNPLNAVQQEMHLLCSFRIEFIAAVIEYP